MRVCCTFFRHWFTVLWMSGNGCWCLHWVFLSVQNIYINCFLIKKDMVSFSVSVSLLWCCFLFFFSARISPSMLFSVTEFVVLDLLRLVLFIWQKGKLLCLPAVLSSVLKVAIIMAPLSRKCCAWLKLMKSKPKEHNIFLLHVFMSNWLAKDAMQKLSLKTLKKGLRT